MAHLTRQEVLQILQGDWADYVRRFRDLAPEGQAAFLVEQGYARFADLLAHIVAWWEVGYQSIERYLADPSSQPGEYDVDAFNAEAVAKAAGLSEAHVIESFDKMRLFLIDFVKHLPDGAFESEKVTSQFSMEFIEHLDEHRIPGTE